MLVHQTHRKGVNTPWLSAGERSNGCALTCAILFIFLEVLVIPLLMYVLLDLFDSTGDFFIFENPHIEDNRWSCIVWWFIWPALLTVFAALLHFPIFLCSFCIWRKSYRESLIKALSFCELKTEDYVVQMFLLKMVSLTAGVILYATTPNIRCSSACSDEVIYSLQMVQSKVTSIQSALLVNLVVTFVFVGTRCILNVLLKDVEITDEMVWFRLCYLSDPLYNIKVKENKFVLGCLLASFFIMFVLIAYDWFCAMLGVLLLHEQ